MLNFVFLTNEFYTDYAQCKEIVQKQSRPFVQVQIVIDGCLYCVPLRSNVSHQYVLWTDKANSCGLDFTKTVVVLDSARYIDNTNTPHIRSNEFNALRGKEHIIETRLIKYIKDYKEAKKRMDRPRNKMLVKFSALQYFEEYL